jgi:hypothetical protein
VDLGPVRRLLAGNGFGTNRFALVFHEWKDEAELQGEALGALAEGSDDSVGTRPVLARHPGLAGRLRLDRPWRRQGPGEQEHAEYQDPIDRERHMKSRTE